MDVVATQPVVVEKVRAGGRARQNDVVVVEEPLEIRIDLPGAEGEGRPISVTMRTPGQDMELALGFLYGEGLIRDRGAVRGARHCGPTGNVVRVELRAEADFDFRRLERNFYTTSSCGVCGKASIEAVTGNLLVRRIEARWNVAASVLLDLPRKLRAAQASFEVTGGLHAVGLFTHVGDLVSVHEDVGRHNAFDKLVGSRLLADALPLSDSIVLLSGRASFELVQKAGAAGVPVLAAIGAPSSLAIDLAQTAGITLVAFLRDGAFNVYTHGERVSTEADASMEAHAS